VCFRVSIDGQPPASAHGLDVDERGYGRMLEPRLYQLIRQPKPVQDRQYSPPSISSNGSTRAHHEEHLSWRTNPHNP
jgi:hypothetical protein